MEAGTAPVDFWNISRRNGNVEKIRVPKLESDETPLFVYTADPAISYALVNAGENISLFYGLNTGLSGALTRNPGAGKLFNTVKLQPAVNLANAVHDPNRNLVYEHKLVHGYLLYAQPGKIDILPDGKLIFYVRALGLDRDKIRVEIMKDQFLAPALIDSPAEQIVFDMKRLSN